MRIDYCPKCNKAGLKYLNPQGLDPDGNDVNRRYELSQRCNAVPSSYGTAKWCPRCNEWVKPQNRPYIGSRGVG